MHKLGLVSMRIYSSEDFDLDPVTDTPPLQLQRAPMREFRRLLPKCGAGVVR